MRVDPRFSPRSGFVHHPLPDAGGLDHSRLRSKTRLIPLMRWTVERPMKSTSGCRPVVVHRGSRREDVGRDGRGVLTHTRRFVVDAVFGSIFTSDSVQVASISPSSNCDRLLDSNLGGATVM